MEKRAPVILYLYTLYYMLYIYIMLCRRARVTCIIYVYIYYIYSVGTINEKIVAQAPYSGNESQWP